MIICWSLGGIGNQMFHYAFGYTMSKKLNKELKFDLRDYSHKKYFNPEGFVLEKIFNLKLKKAEQKDYFKIFGLRYPLFFMRSRINLNSVFKLV